MLMAHLLELKRLVDPASSSVAQQENLEKTKVMLEQAKASVAGTCARARCRVRGGNNAMCGCMGMCVLGYMRARARTFACVAVMWTIYERGVDLLSFC